MAAVLKTIEQEDQPVSVEEIVLSSPGDDMDAMFDELEAGFKETLTVVSTEEHSESDMIQVGRQLTTDQLRQEALVELDEASSPTPDNAVMPSEQKAKAKTARVSTIGMAKSVALAVTLGDKLEEMLTIDASDLDLSDEDRFTKRFELLEAIDTLPIKIGEKVANLFSHIAKGAALSNYTAKAIEHLNKEGSITTKSLKDVYLARPYTEGTASSQTTQMMKLLPILGIAVRSGNMLVVNEKSLLLPLLALAAKATVEADEAE